MTERVSLDHLTSDQYDALCAELAALRRVARGYCPACGRGDAAPTMEDWERERQRAEQAEAALTRARQARRRISSACIAVESLLTKPYPDDPRWTPWTRFVGPALKELHAVLDQPGPAGTAPAVHVGGGANAEDCPACSTAAVPPPYPWICPGPAGTEATD